MPFSRSRSIESMTRSATSWLARKAPDCQSMASTRVVLPWSTWATMATLRRSWRAAGTGLRLEGGGEPGSAGACRRGCGGPTTTTRRLRAARPRAPGDRLSHRIRHHGLGRRRRGGRAGRVREGVPRPRALPGRCAVPALAAGDRRQRGAQQAPLRGPARALRAAPDRGAPLRRRGPVSGGGAPRPRGARAAPGGDRHPRRGAPAGRRLPLPARAVRAGDRVGARLSAWDREVAAVARAGSAGGHAMSELETRLAALDIEWPETPDVAAAVRQRLAETDAPRRGLRRRLAVAVAAFLVALGGVMAVPSARSTVLDWLGLDGVEI